MEKTLNISGTIKSFNGIIVDVLTTAVNQPKINSVLFLKDALQVPLLVLSYSDKVTARCLNITASNLIYHGAIVVSDGSGLSIPVGKEVIGHVFNALGQSIDVESEMFRQSQRVPVFPSEQKFRQYQALHNEVLETGIKAIDFFTPFVKGRKIGIIGGAGVGKTVLTTELMHNVGNAESNLTIFVGIGERMREGHELYNTLKSKDLLKSSIMYLGQMNENAGLRSIIGLSAVESARYFRDQEKMDILFFVDNIYRHVQANNELSTMMGELPAEGGYQPTMYSDLRRLMERLDSNNSGTITSVQSIYIPSDDLTDPAVLEISQQLDAVIVLSRAVFESGIYPAVDLLNTTSSLVSEEVVGARHANLVVKVKEVLQKYESLKGIIAVIGESELSPTDRADYRLALEFIQYFAQAMFVTEDLSGIPGIYISREQTLKGVEEILERAEKKNE